jgi:hypothetical protein
MGLVDNVGGSAPAAGGLAVPDGVNLVGEGVSMRRRQRTEGTRRQQGRREVTPQ